MNVVSRHISALCVSLYIMHRWSTPVGTRSTTRRKKPVESSTRWPYHWFRHHAFSSLPSPASVTPTSMLATLPDDSHLWFIASLPTLLRNDLSTQQIMSQGSLSTCLQGHLFVHTVMQMVPSFLLSVLPLVGFCTYTLGRSSLYLSGLRRSLQMGKELSDESWGKSRNDVKYSIKSIKVKQIRKVKGEGGGRYD